MVTFVIYSRLFNDFTYFPFHRVISADDTVLQDSVVHSIHLVNHAKNVYNITLAIHLSASFDESILCISIISLIVFTLPLPLSHRNSSHSTVTHQRKEPKNLALFQMILFSSSSSSSRLSVYFSL